MKKNISQSVLPSLLALGAFLFGIFLFMPKAHAALLANQPFYDQTSDASGGFGGGLPVQDFGTTYTLTGTFDYVNFGSTKKLGYIDVWIAKSSAVSCSGSMYIRAVKNGVIGVGSDSVAHDDLPLITPTRHRFTFSLSSTIDFSTEGMAFFEVNTTGGCGFNIGWSSFDSYSGGRLNTSATGTPATQDLAFSVLDQDGQNVSMSFQNPPFAPGFVSPDFKNWWYCETLPPGTSLTGYYATVQYGTSTSFAYTDSLKSLVGVLPWLSSNVSGGVSDCPVLTKSTPLPVGHYYAQANLYNQSDVLLSTSDILQFDISTSSTSTPLEVPNQSLTSGSFVQDCQPTSFALNFGFGSVDFGYEGCKLGRFLLVPSQSSVSQFTSTNSVMATKPPFSFFYNLTTTLQNISTSSTSTLPTLRIDTGTSTPIHVAVDMLSPATINKFTDSNSRGTMRTVSEYAIYLMFAAMIILEVRHLFKSNASPAK